MVFPLVTLAFTLFTIKLSHHYLSSTQPGQQVVVYDVAKGDRVARSSRFEPLFSCASTEYRSGHRNSSLVVIDHHQFGATGHFTTPYGLTGRLAAPEYTGRFPNRYSVHLPLAQGTSVLRRHFEISPQVDLLDFDWDNPGDVVSNEGRLRLQSACVASS